MFLRFSIFLSYSIRIKKKYLGIIKFTKLFRTRLIVLQSLCYFFFINARSMLYGIQAVKILETAVLSEFFFLQN